LAGGETGSFEFLSEAGKEGPGGEFETGGSLVFVGSEDEV